MLRTDRGTFDAMLSRLESEKTKQRFHLNEIQEILDEEWKKTCNRKN